MNELEKAIKDIEEARESHVLWRDHLLAYPNCIECQKPIATLIDKPEDEQAWIDKYDNVLKVLNAKRDRE